jgi:adenosylcobinamide kinase/adenosylcobinamide-phosphate guanylyltransferase
MEERIRRHRERRPARWSTLEEPLDLASELNNIQSASHQPPAVLIDSLDTWVSNMLLEHEVEGNQAEKLTLAALDSLLEIQLHWPESWFLVSSEVGLSPVPPNVLGRRFQDLLGLVNQRVAAAAGRVCLVVAGIPVEIKGSGLTAKGLCP